TAIVGSDLVASASLFLKYNDRGPLIRSFRDNFDGASAPESPEAHAGPLPDKAAEAGQALRPTGRLNVFVHIRLSGRHSGSVYDDVVGLKGWRPVYGRHDRSDQWFIAVAMA